MISSGLFNFIGQLMFLTGQIEHKNSFPKPLNSDKEKTLLERWLDGDKSARDDLIHHNMRLVVHIAKKYSNYYDSDELVSVGSIGLIKAVNTFTKDKGTQLATYAAKCIENEILMMLRSNKKHKNNKSIYDPVSLDKDGNEITLIEIIPSTDEDLSEHIGRQMMYERMLGILPKVLTAREFDIIKMRYGICNKETLTQIEIAKKFKISRSYVSRIEKNALKKIREYISDNKIEL